MQTHEFMRREHVSAYRLNAASPLVKTGAAKAGDWHVFDDGGDAVVPNDVFVQEYSGRTVRARKVLAEAAADLNGDGGGG